MAGTPHDQQPVEPITAGPFTSPSSIRDRPPHLGLRPYSLRKVCGFLVVSQNFYVQGLWNGAYGLSSLSEKTWKCNHLQISLQKAALSPSYLNTLSVDLAGVWSLSNWANQAVINKIVLLWKRFQNSFIFIRFSTFSSVVKNFTNWGNPEEGLPNLVFKRNRIWLWIERFMLGWRRNSCMSMTAAAWVIWLCTCVKHCTGSGLVGV